MHGRAPAGHPEQLQRGAIGPAAKRGSRSRAGRDHAKPSMAHFGQTHVEALSEGVRIKNYYAQESHNYDSTGTRPARPPLPWFLHSRKPPRGGTRRASAAGTEHVGRPHVLHQFAAGLTAAHRNLILHASSF